jgi:hypothetical protein
MKIKSIKSIGKQKVYDVTVEDAEHYVLENGVVTHNTGLYYSANQIFMIGRSQEKDGTEVSGYNFTINIDKSRFVKEKSKLAFSVNFDAGINKWSGLMDLALECGLVKKPSNGWFSHVDAETGEISDKKWRMADTNSKEFWLPVLQQKAFQDFVEQKFKLATASMMQFDDSED